MKIRCPVCHKRFVPRGVQKYCSARCRRRINHWLPPPYSAELSYLLGEHRLNNPSPEWAAAHEARIKRETERVQADLARLERSNRE